MNSKTKTENGITYTEIGGIMYPNFTLNGKPTLDPEAILREQQQVEEEPRYMGKYGWMRESYLKEHQLELYMEMMDAGTLEEHLLDIQETATNRLESMMKGLVKKNPPPDKATDQMGWVAHMNMLKEMAEEVIRNELIYE